MSPQGVFNLQTPRDLLEKARHDLDRLRKNPISTYAAFDFFVAIRHIPDWMYPLDTQKADRDDLFKAHVELRIARHIADQGKHFEVTSNQLKQVAGTTRTAPAFQAGAFQNEAFQAGTLEVILDSRDPATTLFGTRIRALDLAERTFTKVESLVP